MKLENFSVKVNGIDIISHFTYEFNYKYIYHIYGQNGAGKSTFAKALAGFIKYKGNMDIDRKKLGMVSSYTNIPDEISVKDLIKFLTSISSESKDYKSTLFELCNIKQVINSKKISKLSDGEKRKLAIYSALINKKEILVFDELINSLDKSSAEEIRKFILKLHKTFKFICINITHSFEDARALPGKILFLDKSTHSFKELNDIDDIVKLM